MRILIVRHADPDYINDSLTEKGKREAQLLADRLGRLPVSAFYISTMGRARETALPTIQKCKQNQPAGAPDPIIREYDWLREFPHLIERPDVPGQTSIVWDWLPLDWTAEEAYFHRKEWLETDIMRKGRVREKYQEITNALDAILASHGYRRKDDYYLAERPNRDIVAFFCHFGLACVLLSHLLNVSPMILWHHTCALPSSVTSLYTEERRKGIALFRMNAYGDTSHLYSGNEEPSFSARFCETWDNMDERHD